MFNVIIKMCNIFLVLLGIETIFSLKDMTYIN